MPFVVRFDDYTSELRPLLGGKNAGLGELTAAGLPIPPGYAITTEAFATLWADVALARDVAQLLSGTDPSNPTAMELIFQAVRARIDTAALPTGVAQAVASAYQQLCERCGMADLPVAVRSSATGEDSANASFAGQHDTFLWVRGADEVARHVVRCWSSLWTARAMYYRDHMGSAPVAMSVGVQKMVRPKSAGVAFTLNPGNGDRSQVAIDASWGVGETVVAGTVTPDHFLVDKVVFEITGRWISETFPCLTDAEIKAVARLARLVERHFGSPQDIEWAIDSELEPPGNVVLLQARPETVWSHRERAPVARASSVLDSIVSTLCAPLSASQYPKTTNREERDE
ncbi:MAG: PEP/pyruvate-binding domain-containing protein [Pseudonocardiaceae bacterium]